MQIISIGIFRSVREWCPDLNIHVSTQASTSNWRTARAWKNMGASRVVLARELSLDEIQEIHDKAEMETEVFIHGAMCISWSAGASVKLFYRRTEGFQPGRMHTGMPFPLYRYGRKPSGTVLADCRRRKRNLFI